MVVLIVEQEIIEKVSTKKSFFLPNMDDFHNHEFNSIGQKKLGDSSKCPQIKKIYYCTFTLFPSYVSV
jgi:hypothetical protein